MDTLLAMRRHTHGDYAQTARTAQELKLVMRGSPGWMRLDACRREALEAIATKLGRILSGDPGHADHWDDIAGYARLVVKQVEGGDA